MTTLNGHALPLPHTVGQTQTEAVLASADAPQSIKAAVSQHVVEAPESPKLQPPADILLSDDEMTGKKIVPLERPDDNARHLASLLTLEEQVLAIFLNCSPFC